MKPQKEKNKRRDCLPEMVRKRHGKVNLARERKGDKENGFFWLLKLETHKSCIYDQLLVFLSIFVSYHLTSVCSIIHLIFLQNQTLARFWFNPHTA